MLQPRRLEYPAPPESGSSGDGRRCRLVDGAVSGARAAAASGERHLGRGHRRVHRGRPDRRRPARPAHQLGSVLLHQRPRRHHRPGLRPPGAPRDSAVGRRLVVRHHRRRHARRLFLLVWALIKGTSYGWVRCNCHSINSGKVAAAVIEMMRIYPTFGGLMDAARIPPPPARLLHLVSG